MSYGDIDLGQLWLVQLIVCYLTAHQGITWTSVDLSSKVFCGIHLWAIPQEMCINLIRIP